MKQYIIILALLFSTLLSFGQQKGKQISQKEVADLAVEMEGGDNSGNLPWRLKLKQPLPFSKGGDWFKDAGLGLFIHWGPTSAYYGSPWKMRRPSSKGADTPMISYEDYYNSTEKFKAENYAPSLWIEAAKKAGFKYVVLTSKHHDGYTLWPSSHTDFGVQKYLNGKDLIQPYVDAVKENDLKLGFYYSGVDWYLDREYMSLMKTKKGELNWKGEYVKANTIPSLPLEIIAQKKKIALELMEKYTPDLWWWDSGLPLSLEETALTYNTDMVFNNRGNVHHKDFEKGPYPGAHYVTPENFHNVQWKYMKKLQEKGIKWEVCMGINLGYGWFYDGSSKNSEKIRNLGDILFAAARVRSWGGNLLLNIKPRPDGTLPEENYKMFERMERWMLHSGISFFDVKGTHFPEYSNVPITTSKDGFIWYVHARPGESKWQKGGFYEHCEPGEPIRIQNIKNVVSVKLLRTGEKVAYSFQNNELVIENPDANPDGLHEVFEVRLKNNQ